MSERLSEETLGRLSELISNRLGLFFPPERWAEMQRKVESAAAESGLGDVPSYVGSLFDGAWSREQAWLLAAHLTIGETYFFREQPSFEALRETILPLLARHGERTGRSLRLWSAGCATGEEPYSLAILLHSMHLAPPQWKVSILATDLNLKALERARSGSYRHWSFRSGLSMPVERYFSRLEDGEKAIAPQVREMVRFEYLNLAEDCYPSLLNGTSALDLILCRNVLMYFNPDSRREVIERFHRCLRPEGWLLVSPCEASIAMFPEFETVNFSAMVAFRKAPAVRPAVIVPPRPQAPPAALKVPLGSADVVGGKPVRTAPQPEKKELDAQAGAVMARPSVTVDIESLYAAGEYSTVVEHLAGRLPVELPTALLLIKSLANLGEFVRGLELCRLLVDKNRFNPGLHYLQAMLLIESSRPDEAAQALGKTLYLDPDHALAHFALGQLAQRDNHPGRARKHLRLALGILERGDPDAAVPDSEGLTAGHLAALIRQMLPVGGNRASVAQEG